MDEALETSDDEPVTRSRWLRLLPVAFITFFAVAAAVYCVSWYFQANYAKAAIERVIADINRQQQRITYSSIEVSGFPLDVNVHIMQPKFSPHLTPPATAGKEAEWIEQISLNGSLTLGVNVLSDRFTLVVDGPASIDLTHSTLTRQPKGPMVCSLEMNAAGGLLGGLWNLDRLASLAPDDLIREFRSVQCASQGYTVTADNPRETAMDAGPYMLRLANVPESGSMRTIEVIMRLTDFEISQRMNTLLNAYIASLYGMPGALPGLDLAAYGKQNVDIAFTMRGPSDLRVFSDDMPFSVALSRFNLSNALYSTATNLRVDNNVRGDTHAINFMLSSDSSFSKAYDQYLTDYVRIMVSRIRVSDDPQLAEMHRALATLSDEQAMALLEPVVPKLHSFGNISVRINAGVEGDKILRKGNLVIGTLDLSAAPYGLSIQGNSALPQDRTHAPPNATFTLSCRNCMMLVDDAAHYGQRLQQALAGLDKSYATTTYFSPALAQGIQSFLNTLGDKHHDAATGAETLTFTLTSDATGNLSLNGRPPQQVMQLYSTAIAPYLPTIAPARPAAPEQRIPPGGY